MRDHVKGEFLERFGEEGKAALKELSALSDDALAEVVGGVGGAGEGTCWKCGAPAEWDGSVWFCKNCHQGVSLDDAEAIALIKKLEASVGKEHLEKTNGYPVWWKKVVH